MKELDVNEARLLLYCETCAVDYDSRMDDRHLNGADLTVLEGWCKEGFIAAGYVAMALGGPLNHRSRWCRLSEKAWQEAHRQRRLRAERGWKLRQWISTAAKGING